MRKFFFILLLLSYINPLYSLAKQEALEISPPLTKIRLAYSWGSEFEKYVSDFADGMKDEFILESEPNEGLDHKQKILIDISCNNLPDIFFNWSYETNLKYLAKNNYLINIDEYFFETTEIQKDNFFSETYQTTLVDGINYAIPFERFYGFWAVNTEMFDRLDLKLPQTWEDIRDISPILQSNGIVPFAIGSFRGDPGHLLFSALSAQQKDGIKDTRNIKNTNNFIYPGSRQAAQAIEDLISWKSIPDDTLAVEWDEQIRMYNDEEAAMIYTFNWRLASFNEEIAANTRIIPVPRINPDANNTSGITIGGSAQCLCINRKSWEDPEKRAAIVKIVDWLLSDELYLSRLKLQGIIPAKKITLPTFSNPIFDKYFSYIKNKDVFGIHEFYFKRESDFNVYKNANDLLWSGSINSEEFLTLIQAQLEKR